MSDFKQKFDEMIGSSSKVVVTSHMRPDHDAMGSLLAMGDYLKQKETNYVLTIEGERTSNFDYLEGIDTVKWVDSLKEELINADTLIFLDGNSLNRFSEDLEGKDVEEISTVCIDHHKSEGGEFDLRLIDTTAAATCQILAEELFEGDDITSSAVNNLVEGIMGDTGSLRYIRPHNSRVLTTMERLVNLGGIDLELINMRFNIFEKQSFNIFQKYIANTVTLELEGKPNLTYSYLGKEFINSLEDFSLTKGGRYLFLILRQIEDHPWGFTVIYDPHNPTEFKLSFRSSTGAVNVRLLCEQHFDGGGHDPAAGGTYKLKESEQDWDSKQVAEKIVEIIKSANLQLIE